MSRGYLHLPGQRSHCLSLLCLTTDLDFCRNCPCLGTNCCFSEIRGIRFSSQAGGSGSPWLLKPHYLLFAPLAADAILRTKKIFRQIG